MPNYRSDLVDLEVEYLHQTEGAILIKDADNEIWLPKSIVEADTDGLRRGDTLTITLPERWAMDKGLI